MTDGEQAAADAVAAVATDGVHLLYAGELPQRELRHIREDNRHERMSVELNMVAAAALGGSVTPEMAMPPIHLTIEAGPTELTGRDRMRYGMRVSGASIDAPPDTEQSVLDEMAREVAALQQISGFVEVDGRGYTSDSGFRAPDGVTTRTRAMLGNIRQALITVPFPEEPVGVGAQWMVTRPLDLGTVVVQQTVTYTLTALEGDRGHLELTIRQGATPQAMRTQDETISGRLHAYESSGVGYLEFDLNQLAPWSEVDMTTQMRSTVTVDGVSALMQLRMRTAVSVYPEI